MGYREMFVVRASGMTDRTQVDVLEALAFFQNSKTGMCFPSTDALARVSRVNANLVRKTIRALEECGLVSCTQEPGCPRHFVLHLEKIPKVVDECNPLEECEPLEEPQPLNVCEPNPLRKVKGTPLGKLRGPLEEPQPEQGIEQRIEQGIEQGRVAHACASTVAPPQGFDDEAEAEWNDLTARAALEADSMPEDVFSPDGQTPCESISKQRDTQFNSVFGDDPSEAQDAVTRKSEACSKPKQPRKERTPRVRFPEDIPEDWRVDAQKLRPEIDAQATFTKMRCWLGANNTTTKTMRQWKTQFLGWIGREKKGFGHYAGNHRADRPHQGYAGFGARNTAEIDYNYGLPVRGAVG